MGYIVLTGALAFQKTEPDNPMVPLGPEQIVRRGGRVPDFVREFQISALSNAGVIGPAPEDSRLEPEVDDAAPAVPNAEVPPPPGVFTPVPENPSVVDDPEDPAPPAPTAKPKVADNKDAWEDYAVTVGVPRAEAEAMTKTALIAEVNRRETPLS